MVTIGLQTGGFAGISFGSSADVRLSKTATAVLQMATGLAFGMPEAATSVRATAANAAAGGMYWDSTTTKLMVSDGPTGTR